MAGGCDFKGSTGSDKQKRTLAVSDLEKFANHGINPTYGGVPEPTAQVAAGIILAERRELLEDLRDAVSRIHVSEHKRGGLIGPLTSCDYSPCRLVVPKLIASHSLNPSFPEPEVLCPGVIAPHEGAEGSNEAEN